MKFYGNYPLVDSFFILYIRLEENLVKRKALAFLIATVMATEIISTQAVSVYATTKSSNASINSSLQGTLEVRLKFDVPLKLRKTEETKLNLSLKLGDKDVVKIPVGNNDG